MADTIARSLTDARVRNARPGSRPVKLADGGGLFLQIMPNGSKLWRYKFRLGGREGLLSLGAYPDVTLSDARDAHRVARAQVAAGQNPVEARRADRAAAERQAAQAQAGRFDQVVASWRATTDRDLAAATIRQRDGEIRRHLLPAFGSLAIEAIGRRQIADLLKRVEARAPETARNVRTHLGGIIEHAIGLGLLAASPVPPRSILRRRSQVPRAAITEARLPDLLRLVDSGRGEPLTRAALALVILTATRKTEMSGAAWCEFDLDAAEWLIPAARMKARRDHWVPLPRQAVAILRDLRAEAAGDLVFPNMRDRARPMSERALNEWLKRVGFGGVTVHGFRSVFSTRYNALGRNPDVIEAVLAHAPADRVRAAYNRHQYRDERRALLQEWADHLDAIRLPNVVSLRA